MAFPGLYSIKVLQKTPNYSDFTYKAPSEMDEKHDFFMLGIAICRTKTKTSTKPY
jgi:hypothetical protein